MQNSEKDKRAPELIIANNEHLLNINTAELEALAKLGSWETDLQTFNVKWSEETHRIFETDPETFYPTHETFLPFIHPDDLDKVNSAFQNSINSTAANSIEHRIITPNGTLKYVIENWKNVQDEKGNAVRALGTCQDITERKIAEEEQSLLVSIINSTDDAIITKNVEGIITSWNNGAQKTFGYAAKEVIGKPISILIPSNLLHEEKGIFEKIKKGKHVNHYETQRVRKDRKIINVSLTISPIKDSFGNIVGASKISRDIKGRKIAEDKLNSTSIELEAAVTSLNRIIDSSLDVICTINANGEFVSISLASLSVWGYIPEELIGSKFINLVYDEDADITLKTAEAIVSGTQVPTFENRYVHKSGRLVPILWSINWDEKLQLMFCVAKDLTEKKRMEKAVATEKHQFFEIFSKAPTAISMVKGPDHVFEMANSSYLELTGKKNIIGKTVKVLFPEVIEQGFITILDNVYKTGESYIGNEVLLLLDKRGDGELVDCYINFIYQAYRNAEGNIAGIFTFANDITEQILSRKAIEKSEKFFKGVIENSDDMLTILSPMGETIYASPAVQKKFGYTYEECLNLNLNDVVHPDDALTMHAFVGEIMMHPGVPMECPSIRNRKKDGSYIWVEGTLTNFLEAEGINAIVANFRDVTEKMKARKAIEESNERFDYVTKATFDAIWDWNLITDTIYWGEGFEKIFGYKISDFEASSESWRNNIHPEDLQRIAASYYTIIKSSETNWIEEYRFKKGDGDYAYVINKGIVVSDTDNRVTRIVGAMHDITKQKQEEQRLKLLESVITNTTDSVLITEAEPFDLPGNRILFVNEAFTKMTGYSAEEVIGKTPRILQGPKTDQNELNKLSAALRRWEACDVTLLNYKKNGEEFWIHISLTPVANKTGWFTHWIAIERDVTKQKEEEEQLKILEAVITNANDAVVIKEANPSSKSGRKIIFVNESFTRMTGYTKSEIVGKTHKLLQGPNSDADELVRFYKALDDKQSTEITIINYKKNGEEFWNNLVLNPIFNERGEHTHWVSIERDVTERKKQEAELAVINQKLLDTLESIQDGFYKLDNNWDVSYWNQEAERISGKSQQEIIGKNIWNVYEGRISKIMYTQFHKAKEENKPVRLEIYSKIQNKWFDINAFPSSMGLTVYFKNITERKQNESKLKKMNRELEVKIRELAISNQELEQFAYIASHDLQEPLRMVTGFLTQIEKRYEEILDEKGKKYIFFAVDGAKRMRQIILDLLEFSRIGKSEKKSEEIDLNEILKEVVLLYGNQIKEKNATINFKDLPKIRSYPGPIKQIFQNLISNGLKYSKSNEPPIINIICKETSQFWQFIVQDNGIGIDQEYFDKIFVIFQRLHNKDEYSGTGIGLAITKKIIESLGGKIWVESTEGFGTAFRFTIPKKQTKKS